MLAEQLIFTVISLAIFVYTFFKMIRKNDTSYVIILILEAIGIALNFIEFVFTIKLNIVLDIAKYVLSILLPIIAIILETRGITLFELINITKAKFYLAIGNDKKAKEALIRLITKMPNSYKGHKLLAELYEKEGGMRKAIDEYVQAIDINKKDYNSYYKVAELLDNLDKKDEAAEMLFNLLNKSLLIQNIHLLIALPLLLLLKIFFLLLLNLYISMQFLLMHIYNYMLMNLFQPLFHNIFLHFENHLTLCKQYLNYSLNHNSLD